MSDVSKTNDELEKLALAAEDAAGGPPSAEQVDALIEYADALRDALEAATHEQDTEGDIRRAVRLWSERFIPGDRWDTEDARDLDAALKCVVGANPDRSRARVPIQGEPRCETCNDVGLVGSDHMNSGNCPDCNPYVMPLHELYRTNVIDVINRAANEWTLQREVLYPRNNVTQAQHIVRRVAEFRDPAVQGEPNDDREAVTKFPAIILDSAFIRWRNVEIDRTGTLPEGFEMFRAGWNRAVAAVNGEHDHIEDGNSYLDCGACEMERKER